MTKLKVHLKSIGLAALVAMSTIGGYHLHKKAHEYELAKFNQLNTYTQESLDYNNIEPEEVVSRIINKDIPIVAESFNINSEHKVNMVNTEQLTNQSLNINVNSFSTMKEEMLDTIKLANTINLSYGEKFDGEMTEGKVAEILKIEQSREEYLPIVEKYSSMFGIDSELFMAQLCQERMTHSNIIDDGGAIGISQIQVSVWVGKNITFYNFDKGDYETFTVTLDMLKSLEGNIKVGAAIYQNYLCNHDYNVLAALQAYNSGNGVKNRVIQAYANSIGKTVDEVLEDQTDTNWLDYRYLLNYGDSNYVENVLRYYQGSEIKYKKLDENMNEIDCSLYFKEKNEDDIIYSLIK